MEKHLCYEIGDKWGHPARLRVCYEQSKGGPFPKTKTVLLDFSHVLAFTCS